MRSVVALLPDVAGAERVARLKNQKTDLSPFFLFNLAEAVRFELTEDSHPRQFSRLLHSTALPRFRADEFNRLGVIKRQDIENIPFSG